MDNWTAQDFKNAARKVHEICSFIDECYMCCFFDEKQTKCALKGVPSGWNLEEAERKLNVEKS